MSYILDALKRADAERERGAIPGLHSQPQAPMPDDEEDQRKAKMPPIVWLSAGAAICLIGVLSWQLLMRPGAAPDQVAVAPAMPSGQTEPTNQAPASRQPTSVTQPTPPTFFEADEPQPGAVASTSRNRSPANAQGNQRSSSSKDIGADDRRAVAAGNANANTAPAQASQRVPTFNELPDDVRREIPAMTIGGAMYSETPASRMLIVNSQVFHEGDRPYQGLQLEEIRLKSAIFKYRGYRYSINY